MNLATTTNALSDRDPTLRCPTADDSAIGWKENIFLPGNASGVLTVRRLTQAPRQRELVGRILELTGAFGIFACDARADRWLVLNDNGGLHRTCFGQTAGPHEPGREDCRTALPVGPDRQAAG